MAPVPAGPGIHVGTRSHCVTDAAKIEFYRRKVTKHRALARASPTTDLSMRINALPTELVWKIISFWRTARDAPGNLLD